MKIDKRTLQQRQEYPLWIKEGYTEKRIKDFYNHYCGQVYVSFSGGKDSTALLHIARKLYPDIKAVYIDTGLEYPEIRSFVKAVNNVEWLKPKMNFKKVIETYGYPVISKENAQKIYEIRNTKSEKLLNKRLNGDSKGNGKLPEKWKYMLDAPFKISGKCCNVMKKIPVTKFEKETGLKPIVGTMASDSRLRETSYLKQGCNSFDSKRPMSTPMSFWTDEDVWGYIEKYNVNYSNIYDMGYKRTGCMFCLFGLHLEKGETRLDRMKITHPKQYNYCMENLEIKKVLEYMNHDEQKKLF
jgi:3'-phosphoadenosine 5'-phosphosulfate sulfotransferase (PAPS reductase)/FAD synthetase